MLEYRLALSRELPRVFPHRVISPSAAALRYMLLHAVTCCCNMPLHAVTTQPRPARRRLVWEHGAVRLACVISLSALGLSNLIFNVAMQVPRGRRAPHAVSCQLTRHWSSPTVRPQLRQGRTHTHTYTRARTHTHTHTHTHTSPLPTARSSWSACFSQLVASQSSSSTTFATLPTPPLVRARALACFPPPRRRGFVGPARMATRRRPVQRSAQQSAPRRGGLESRAVAKWRAQHVCAVAEA